MDSSLKTILAIFLISVTPTALSQDVSTEPTATLWAGEKGALTCQYSGAVQSVLWRNAETTLVQWSPTGVVLGDDTRFNMTDDYTLLIGNVSLLDKGTLRCIVHVDAQNFKVGSTDVTVFAAPDEPYPMIAECISDDRANGTGQYCTLELRNETETVNLTCEARNFSPTITLTWKVDSFYPEPLSTEFRNNSDGTNNAEVTIDAEVNPRPYVCTAEGEAIPGSPKTASITIQLLPPPPSSTTPTTTPEPSGSPNNVGLYVGIALIVVIGILALVFVLYKLWPKLARKSSRDQKMSYQGVAQKPLEDEEAGLTKNDDQLKDEDIKSPEDEPLDPSQKVSVDVIDKPNSSGDEPVAVADEATELANA